MIAGRVTDPTSAVVVGVTITATADTGVAIQTRTNAEGHYVLASLVIGQYRVSIEVPGFRRAVSDVIQVHANTRARLDVQLELGAVNDTISVRSLAPLLQTDASSLSHTVGASQIGQLPLNGRNFSQLATLFAGVLPAFGHVQRESGFNSNGQWAVQNNYLLDGVDNNSQVLGIQDRKAQVLVPNIDAIEEFQVQTSNYSAEFGRGAGAVVNVSIKSGTNAIHGTAHEFFRNDVFDARDAFDYVDRSGDGKADPTRCTNTNSDSRSAGLSARAARSTSPALKSAASTPRKTASSPYRRPANETVCSTWGLSSFAIRRRALLSRQIRSHGNDGIRWPRSWWASGRCRISMGRRAPITRPTRQTRGCAASTTSAWTTRFRPGSHVRPRQLDGLQRRAARIVSGSRPRGRQQRLCAR